MTEARVDVVMSVFNGARFLEDAVNSIRNQTVKDIKIIIVDDGSTDDTGAILRRIAERDDRLIIISKPNSGIVDSVEIGLAHGTAPFVARHDADDRSYPDRFEVQLAYFNQNPDCVALSGGSRYIDEDGRETGNHCFIVDVEAADLSWIPAREPYLMQPFMMMRRDALNAAGGYRPLRVAEDTDLCWRLRRIGRLHNMDQQLGDYRVHDSSISSGHVHNGRIIALYSQLAALSAQRRDAGKPDLRFDSICERDYLSATTLYELQRIASDQLEAEERRRLAAAMAAKLVEVSFYRKFKLERSDCTFIREAIFAGSDLMTISNRELLRRSIMEAALIIAADGRLGDALQLLPKSERPRMLARLAFRKTVPANLKALMKRALKRA